MNTARIQIVEDESIIAMEIEASLRNLGYAITSIVNTAQKAIQKAEEDRPDLIMMDIRIQGDQDGIEAAEIIRHRFGIPVIFSTAYLDQERIDRAKITMPFGYVLKPIQDRDLKVTVEMALYVSKVDKARTETEIALKESEHKYASHIQNTPVAVIEFNNELEIASWNSSAKRIFGYTKSEALGQKTFDLLIPEYEQESVRKVFNWGETTTSENINDNKTKDGRIITCHWFNTPMMNLKGEVIGLSSICQDITEQKRTEQGLQDRLISLTQPTGDVSNIHFEDLFNLKEIQKIQDQFASATGVASIITQTNGEPITKPSNFCRLCSEIIRNTEKGRINCHYSDAELGSYNPEGPKIQPCLSGGLWDAGAAISVGGKHIANWLIGQVRDETQHVEGMNAYAQEIGADIEQVISAFNEVPSMSYEQFKSIAEMLFTLANQLSTLAFQNLQQARMISAQVQAEKDLKKSEEKHRQVIENATIAIYVTVEDEFQFFNTEVLRLTGYSAEELRTKPANRLVFKDDQETVSTAQSKHRSGESVVDFTHRIVTKSAEIRWVYVKTVKIIWEGAPAILAFLTDITAQKRAEGMMIQTEKMISLGNLATGIAHEINSPLGAMLQGVQNIERRLFTELKSNRKISGEVGVDLDNLQLYLEKRGIKSTLDGIRQSGIRATGILSNMLHFSRKSESKLVEVDFAGLIDNTLELAGKYDVKQKQDFNKIEIIREFNADLPSIRCTETEIQQVVLNLLVNAAWAAKETATGNTPRINIRAHFEKGMFQFEIEDNGQGMSEETKKHIYEPFFTTKREGEGTGLGLWVSYMIITENHMGTMNVESEPGIGTTFIIQLPQE